LRLCHHDAGGEPRIFLAQRPVGCTKALDLRKAGKTYAEIGQVLGVSEQRAHKVVTEELARLNRERVEAATDVCRLELGRLDTLLAGVWEAAKGGDVVAIDRVVKLMERRARLAGLDKPVKQEIGNLNDQPFKVYGGFDPEQVGWGILRLPPRRLPPNGDRTFPEAQRGS
jgi:hypothetical protein